MKIMFMKIMLMELPKTLTKIIDTINTGNIDSIDFNFVEKQVFRISLKGFLLFFDKFNSFFV
jgi:hypothetical protein